MASEDLTVGEVVDYVAEQPGWVEVLPGWWCKYMGSIDLKDWNHGRNDREDTYDRDDPGSTLPR
jgi:hypothetical protein